MISRHIIARDRLGEQAFTETLGAEQEAPREAEPRLAIGDSYLTGANTALSRPGLWREPAKTRHNVANALAPLDRQSLCRQNQPRAH